MLMQFQLPTDPSCFPLPPTELRGAGRTSSVAGAVNGTSPGIDLHVFASHSQYLFNVCELS